jgi:hypothetical protein
MLRRAEFLTIRTSQLRGDNVALNDIKLIVVITEPACAGADQDVQSDVASADHAYGLFNEADGRGDTCIYRENAVRN